MNDKMDRVATTSRRKRRTHSPELKARILAECAKPGVSVAGIAMAHGINANIVHSWRKRARRAALATGGAVAGFVPVEVMSHVEPVAEEPAQVCIEVHRAGLVLKLAWPVSAAEQLSSCCSDPHRVDVAGDRAGGHACRCRPVADAGGGGVRCGQGARGYLFVNARGTRVKLLVHDGFGVWCAVRRLNQGRFVWAKASLEAAVPALTQAQFDALVMGLPWQRLEQLRSITRT